MPDPSTQPDLSTMTLQSVVAIIAVAAVVAVLALVAYSVVAGSLAWVLLLVVGLLRLVFGTVTRAGSGVRSHLRARRLTRQAVPDLRVRPSG
jgi:hypothetical protein